MLDGLWLGYCVCCLNFKGKEVEGRELKLHRLTADKKLRLGGRRLVKLLNITTLLQGDPNISNNMNSLIFKAVQDFITQSGRFAME